MEPILESGHLMLRRGRDLSIAMALVAVFSGCASHVDYLRDVRQEFYSGDLTSASATIDKRLTRFANDADVLKLEHAVVDLSAGRVAEAERTLREVRDRFDHLDQTDVAEKALSMLTDDNTAAYVGEDYEKVLIRAFLALTNLMGDGSDAAAYALQVGQKQDEIVQAGKDKHGDNPKLAYKHIALGAYLQGVLAEETHLNYDDAARYYVKVCSWEQGFRSAKADVQRAQNGAHSDRGNGVLYVFTLVGRGPYKEETIELPSTVSLLIADRILSATGKHTLPPTIAPIKVPKVVLSMNNVNNIGVSVDGRPSGMTETITDVSHMALEQYEAVYPRVIARAVVRRVVKKGVIYAGKEVIGGDQNPWINLAFDATGVVWEATEAADTRCWGLLPDRIQVLRLEIPVGEHRIGLRPIGGYGVMGRDEAQTVTIADGRNTYMLANFPDSRLVGKILVSQR